MRAHYTSIFLIISLVTFFSVQFINGAESKNRRILHQPLFPVDSAPQPPPPPPPAVPDVADGQDYQPFSNELPTGPPTTLDPSQQPPPLPAIGTAVATPVATHPSTNSKKLAIATASTILTLGMLSAMAFYLYKNCVKHQNDDESRKLVLGGNSQRINQESGMMPPSTNLLCIQTAESSASRGLVVNSTNGANGGPPFRKLSPGSPVLQPLPPLTKSPPPTARVNSPPPMSSSSSSSSDDESQDTGGINIARQLTSSSKESFSCCQGNHVSSSVPHSKRTPPKSRFSASSPKTSPVMTPSRKQSPLPPSPPPPHTTSLGPLQPSKTLPYSPNRTKFSPSPPSPGVKWGRSRSNFEQKISKIPIPPPPPPPPLSTPRNYGAIKAYLRVPKQQSKSPSPKASPSSQRTKTKAIVEEVNNVASLMVNFDADGDKDGARPKMKPLHWDKVRATTNRATVWDQIKSTSFKLNEDAMDSLFGRKTVNSAPPKQPQRKFVLPSFAQEKRILDSKKSQNIAILLRALNVTREEVSEALLDGNPEGLGPELFETLVKMAPSKEEEIKLKDYNDEISKLGPAERFLKAILDIPFVFKRVEAMLYRANFNAEVKYLRKSFQTLEEASEELKSSRLFLKLLEAVLRTGNRMNNGTNRGDAKAFKLDTLLKLADIKGTDGKTTLLHFVVREVIRSEGAATNTKGESLPHKSSFRFNEEEFNKEGLQIVAGLSKELDNVKKAAGMDTDVLSGYVSKLELGLEKVRQVQQYENQMIERDNFFDSMKVFIEEAIDEISRVKAEERKALSLVKEVTQYFHGDDAKQDAQPLRIFVVIRDFLSILDSVCKDVERMQERTALGSGRSFRISANAPLPVLSKYNVHNDTSSDDDSM